MVVDPLWQELVDRPAPAQCVSFDLLRDLVEELPVDTGEDSPVPTTPYLVDPLVEVPPAREDPDTLVDLEPPEPQPSVYPLEDGPVDLVVQKPRPGRNEELGSGREVEGIKSLACLVT